ncbi:MAG: amino acid ABC transporter permease [Deferribacterales bacterium]|nr:amino acid ABC transporter permease [Deferribacterales bacterium]
MDFEYILRITGHMLVGAQTTVLTFIIVIILSLPLGFLVTLAARCPFKPLSWAANFFIYVIRGTPLLLQLLFIYFALPLIPVIGKYLVLERFTAACLGFVINYSAYFAEIFRGGLLAISKGQYEAAKVLGLGRFQTTFYIIIPQMLRVSLPAISNESITLVKDTALLYAVSVPEVLHVAKAAVNRDASILPFFIAALIYLLMILVLTVLFRRIERRYNFNGD